MAQTLQFEFLQLAETNPTTEQEGPNELLASAPLLVPNLNNIIDIRFADNHYHLVMSEQLIPLQEGTVLTGKNFALKIHLETIAEVNNETDENNNLEHHAALILAQATAHSAAPVIEQTNYLQHDELEFLFSNNNNAITHLRTANQADDFSSLLLSGTDPLSLLNQHFQPPEANTPVDPLAIASTTELLITTPAFSDGNILRDLGFYTGADAHYTTETYINSLPATHSSFLGYQDDE